MWLFMVNKSMVVGKLIVIQNRYTIHITITITSIGVEYVSTSGSDSNDGTVDHPLAKFQATFITRKDIKPVTCMQAGWTTIAAAHKMIDWQAEKFEKNGEKWNPVT